MRHGYPYATPAQMGVENEQDAYLATKLAIQCILLNRPTSQIKTFYRGGQDPVAGLKLADITRRGNKVVDAIYNLVNYARTSNETPTDNTILNISKVGDFKDEGNNITQTYSVSSTTSMASYSIRDLTGFPSGSFTADMNGNAKTFFSNGENFKVVIPKSSITGTINGEIMILAHCETYSIYYGEGPSGFQNYALYPDPYQDISKTLTTSITPNTAKITIVKVDKDTKEKLSGVTFNAKYENGQNIGDFTTDSNGVIEIKNLMNGTIILTETKTKESYKLKVDKIAVELNVGESKIVEVENEKMKGKIKVIKVDQDNNQVKLEGVTFQVTNSKGTVVDTLTTNANGEATTKELPINDTYKVKETNTKKEYVLSDKVETVTLKQDEIKTLTFTNEKRKGQIKVIKVDKEHNEIKLEGVTFEVLDENNKVVQTLVTDKNGEATTKRLPIDQQYKVKETKTQETYVLTDEIKTITLKENQITTLTFENLKKKGNLNVVKIDKDNNKIGIGGIVFDLYSKEFNKVIGSYTTDVNGNISVKDLRVGGYSLIEKITNKWYNLAENTEVEIDWKQTTSAEIENELKKGQIKVIKIDKDNNEVKLSGVTFNVIDSNGTILESITTNENGEATTHKYAVRDFEKLTLREVETQKDYVLNDTPQTVELKENEITTIKFENELKKGQIKVIKVDLDNKEVKLAGVKFNVLDESGKVVDKLVTDKNGEAVTKRLPINQEYTVVETETNKAYKLTKETQKVTLKQDEIKSITFTNEKRKGQLRIIKLDKDNNEVLLEGVKFQIKDKTGKVVDEVVTDKNGEATTKRLPVVDEKYTVVETETQKEYVLTEETQTIELKEDEIKSITFENEKIKGKIQINKTSANDNKLTGDKAGTKLEGAKFEIYDAKGNLADTLITDKDGKAFSKLLVIGEYTVKETESGSKFYLVNTEEFKAEIKENLQVVNVDVKEESVDIDVGVKKTGFKETQSKDTIYYDFSDIINKSNVSLDNFTWKDTLPTNALTANKIYTGTWNEELEYSVWYKTNLNDDYVMLVDGLKSTTNNEVKFTDIEFREGEFVTDFEFRFGTVKSGFREIEKPRLYCDMKDNLGNGFVFTNHTMVSGNYEDKYVEDKDDWTTITYYKYIKINEKLPKTGF